MQCSLVNFDDPTEKENFERYFYEAFARVEKQDLIRKIWKWNDEDRKLLLKIPEKRSVVYTWVNEEGRNIFYVAGSYLRENFSQFKFYGFDVPETIGTYCEVLTLFSTPFFNKSMTEVDQKFLRPYCHEQGRMNKCSALLATCAPRLLALYKRWGWELLETKTIDGEVRHFIAYKL